MIEYVRLSDAKEGDILAKTIYDNCFRVLLKEGNKITARVLEVLKSNGYKGVYVERDESELGEVTLPDPLLDINLEFRLLQMIERVYNDKVKISGTSDPKLYSHKNNMGSLLDELLTVLDEAFKKKDLLIEVEDMRSAKNWIFYHSLNTCLLAVGMAMTMGLDKNLVRDI